MMESSVTASRTLLALHCSQELRSLAAAAGHEPRRRTSQSDRKKRSAVVTSAYVNRPSFPQRPWENGYRPPSPRKPIDERWKRSRSRNPNFKPRTPSTSLPFNLEREQALEQLVHRFCLRTKQKEQMRLLLSLGLTMEDLAKVVKKRAEILDYKPSTIKQKCFFLMQYTNMSRAEFNKFFLKFPRILEYNMKKTVQPRLDFLLSIGCKREDLPKILIQAPAVTELSVENTLKPRVEFLTDALGVQTELVTKIIHKTPQLLTYCKESMGARVAFLQEWNMSGTEIATAIIRHPQILHYSVRSMSEHISYLLQIGIARHNIHQVITRFPQILSLDLKVNVIPTIQYLCSELGGTIAAVESNPAVVGLSLKRRIIPRHRFLSSLDSAPMPRRVPLSWFKCSDAVFASNIAKVPLADFIAFKEQFVKE